MFLSREKHRYLITKVANNEWLFVELISLKDFKFFPAPWFYIFILSSTLCQYINFKLNLFTQLRQQILTISRGQDLNYKADNAS